MRALKGASGSATRLRCSEASWKACGSFFPRRRSPSRSGAGSWTAAVRSDAAVAKGRGSSAMSSATLRPDLAEFGVVGGRSKANKTRFALKVSQGGDLVKQADLADENGTKQELGQLVGLDRVRRHTSDSGADRVRPAPAPPRELCQRTARAPVARAGRCARSDQFGPRPAPAPARAAPRRRGHGHRHGRTGRPAQQVASVGRPLQVAGFPGAPGSRPVRAA